VNRAHLMRDSDETGHWSDESSNAPSSEELLTVRDAARLLNVTVSWVYEHARDGAADRLPFVKLGKYVRFDRADLREYVDAKRRARHPTLGRR
jgi:excisionase family DNA binding protein